MPFSHPFRSMSWTLIDQGVVSLGSFVLNVILARSLVPKEYGAFALTLGIMLTLQMIVSSLVHYPLSIRCHHKDADERARLMGASVILVAALAVPIAAAIGLALVAVGRTDLSIAFAVYFLAWQAQEAFRRCLFAEFRHREALGGDVVSYLGQCVLVVALVEIGKLTLPAAIAALSATSAAAAVLQWRRVRLCAPARYFLAMTARDYWRIGSISLVNNVFAVLRVQPLIWLLAATQGLAVTASLQAAQNLVNLANPVVIGLCNIIPQTAAKVCLESGYRRSWHATRTYVVIGAVPLLAYYAGLLTIPGTVLELFYGATSSYAAAAPLVRALVVAALIGYTAEMICSYLHGINEPRLALLTNVIGAAGAIVVGMPLTIMYGPVGVCLAIVLISALRAVSAQVILARVTADERARPA